MKKTSILLAGLFLASGLFAQSKSITYVDIDVAKNQVATMTAENDNLTAENDKLIKENGDLQAQIATNQNTINEINPIMENVKAKGSGLYTIASTMTDKKMKEQAQASITRNKDLQAQLEAKKNELEKSITTGQRTINNNNRKIDVNNSKIQRNKDEIVILNAAITKTEQQQALLTSYMKDVDTFLTNAEAILKK